MTTGIARTGRPAVSRARVARGASPRPRLTLAERREQLIETAARVFAEHGFKGTTTRELAKAAGVTEAVIFQHFPDKEALYAAVLARKALEAGTTAWLDELERRQAAGEVAGLIEYLYRHIVDVHERDPQLARLMVYSALEQHVLSRRLQDPLNRRLYHVLEAFVRDGQRRGEFGDGPPEVLVRALLALPLSHVLQRRLFRPAWPAVDGERLIEHGTRFALSGLAAHTPRAPAPRRRAGRSGS